MALRNAIRLAVIKHGQSVDKSSQPFIGHPLRVMASVLIEDPEVPEYVLEAAVLHDVLEDTGTDYRELLAAGISVEAVALVKSLTRADDEGYFQYVERVRSDGEYSRLIKLCDLADNLNPRRRIPGMKLPDRYERAVRILKGEANED